MILVILGAGASYDSYSAKAPRGGAEGYRPPLANQLFQPRPEFLPFARDYPECQEVAARLRPLADDHGEWSIERAFAALDEDRGGSLPRRKQFLSVRFYLQQMLTSVEHQWLASTLEETNYLPLVDGLELSAAEVEEVVVLSFNYDTLADRAFERRGLISRKSLSGYCEGRVRFYKVHGSVDWWRLVRGMPHTRNVGSTVHDAKELIKSVDSLTPTDVFRIDEPPKAGVTGRAFGGDWYVPAIAIPIANKDEFECPPDHVLRLKADLPKVTRAIVIGWRAADPLFLKLLSTIKPGVPTLIVAKDGTEATETGDRFRDGGVHISPRPYDEGGFSRLVSGERLQQFLHQSKFKGFA